MRTCSIVFQEKFAIRMPWDSEYWILKKPQRVHKVLQQERMEELATKFAEYQKEPGMLTNHAIDGSPGLNSVMLGDGLMVFFATCRVQPLNVS
jgi:hypothetical protein